MHQLILPLFFLAVSGLGACANAPATPAQRAAEEGRLLAPFERGYEVGCSELYVELTPNFHGCISQPAVDQSVHTVSRSEGHGYQETVWTNRMHDAKTAFQVTIGPLPQWTEQGLVYGPSSRFTVLGQLRLRVYEDLRPLTLAATASGEILLVRAPGEQAARDGREFRVADGLVRRQ